MDKPCPKPYLVDESGNIAFLPDRLEELRSYFALAGIDIRTLKTEQDYLQARRKASPFFLDWLRSQVTKRGPITQERRLLLAALNSDDAEFEQLLERHRRRQSLSVVELPPDR